jgi:hypothetical protein
MINFRGLSWAKIETTWHSLRARREAAELERAVLLRHLRDTEPWLDRKRYASKAAYDEMSEYTFNDVLRYRLHEGLAEVRNTLRVLDTFGDKAFKRYGRRALIRVYNRVSDKRGRTRALRELDKAMKKTNRPPSGSSLSRVLDKVAPRTKRKSTIEMVRKLKDKVAKLQKQVKALEKENAQLRKRRKQPAQRKARRKLKAV